MSVILVTEFYRMKLTDQENAGGGERGYQYSSKVGLFILAAYD